MTQVNKHSPQAPTVDLSSAIARLRQKLEHGQTQLALQEAKDLHKRHPATDTAALLLDAYRARITALWSSGARKEAFEILGVAKQRFPAEARALENQLATARVESGDVTALLEELARPGIAEGRASEIHDELRKNLWDVNVVASSGQLPEAHPLRQAARAIVQAFGEAADAALTPAAREALRVIGRQSPLAPWRQFVLALDAFHRHADAELRTLVEHIAADAPAARLAAILIDLVEGARLAAPGARTGAATRQLVAQVTGGVPDLLQLVGRLERSVVRGRDDDAAFMQLVTKLGSYDPDLLKRAVRWKASARPPDAEDDIELFAAVKSALSPAEAHRLFALGRERLNPVDALAYWSEWASRSLKPHRAANDPIEWALWLDHLAQVTIAAQEWTEEVLAENGVPRSRIDYLMHYACNAAGGAAFLDAAGEDSLYMLPFVPACHALAQDISRAFDTKVRPSRLDTDAMRIALEIDPSRDRYRRFAQVLERDDPGALEALLAEWCERHVNDAEPWIMLGQSAERRGALKKALGCFAHAQSVDGVSEPARRGYRRVLFANLMRHLEAANGRLIEKDLAELELQPFAATADARLFFAAVRHWLVAQDADLGDQHPVMAAVPAIVTDVVRHAARQTREPTIVTGANAREQLGSLVLGLRVASAVGLLGHDLFRLDAVAIHPRREDLPADAAIQLLLCEYRKFHAAWDDLYLCSGAGLAHDGGTMPRFLAFRSVALDHGEGWHLDAEQCRALARALARRVGDGETLKLIERSCAKCGRVHGHDTELVLEAKLAEQVLVRERFCAGTLGERRGQQHGAAYQKLIEDGLVPPGPRRIARVVRSRKKAAQPQRLLPFGGQHEGEGDANS